MKKRNVSYIVNRGGTRHTYKTTKKAPTFSPNFHFGGCGVEVYCMSPWLIVYTSMHPHYCIYVDLSNTSNITHKET